MHKNRFAYYNLLSGGKKAAYSFQNDVNHSNKCDFFHHGEINLPGTAASFHNFTVLFGWSAFNNNKVLLFYHQVVSPLICGFISILSLGSQFENKLK